MGIIKRAGDLVYTLRFLKLLTTPFEETKAYKLGIINAEGKRLKSFSLDTVDNRDKYKENYTPFHRLVFNIKRVIPAGNTKLASYASALYLIKDKFGVPEKKIEEGIKQFGFEAIDFLSEGSQWFVLEDKRLTPGSYKVTSDKLLNTSLEEMVRAGDRITVDKDCYPVGEIFGLDVYEVQHTRTRQPIYVTVGELAR